MDKYFKDYNPYRDGIHNDSIILSKAIKECAKNGDRLIVEKGIYKCGTIFLEGGTNIYLEKGAIIKLSDNKDDFKSFESGNRIITKNTWEDCTYNGKPNTYFIFGYDLDNIVLDGEGIIDGSEELFIGKVTKYHIEGAYYPRTPLIYLEKCKNIKILNLTLRKSAFWTIHLVGCDTILIDSVTIKNNPIFTNCDGIDPDHSKNIIIRNCDIYSADDCVVLKSTSYAKEYGAVENVEVYNCRFKSTSAAIKIGTESVSDFKNIYFHDIEIYDTNRGISLMLRDGGNVLDVRFENITIDNHLVSPLNWWGRGEPISITNIKRDESSSLGIIDNVIFKNIKCDSENGITIVGDNILNIELNDILLLRHNKTSWPKKDLDLRPSIYNVCDKDFYDLYIKGNANVIQKCCNFKDIFMEK